MIFPQKLFLLGSLIQNVKCRSR